MRLTDYTTTELKREIDRRATEPVANLARAIRYNEKVQDLLHQDEKWVDGTGIHWKIPDMETSHIYNLLQWLKRHSRRLKFCDEFRLAFSLSGFPGGECAEAALEAEQWDLMETPEEEWFDALPLVRALREEFGKRTAA